MPKTIPSEVSDIERVWMRTGYVDPRSNDCMRWYGATLSTGYGQVHDSKGQLRYAHILMWELSNGKKVPKGMVVRHLCNNPNCVRHSHLEVGTYAENAADKKAAGRTRVHNKVTPEMAAAIRYLYAHGYSQGELAEMLLGGGAAQPTVNRIVQGLTYKDAPGIITKKGRGRGKKRRRLK